VTEPIDCWAYGPVESDSIMKALADNRVLRIIKTNEGFELTEMCDEHYGATLTEEQLIKLGEEIITYAKETF
jgi:hypothetical protein